MCVYQNIRMFYHQGQPLPHSTGFTQDLHPVTNFSITPNYMCREKVLEKSCNPVVLVSPQGMVLGKCYGCHISPSMRLRHPITCRVDSRKDLRIFPLILSRIFSHKDSVYSLESLCKPTPTHDLL